MEPVAEYIQIIDIQEGQEVHAPFLLADLRLAQTKNGKPYVGLKIQDRTGQREARVWDRAEEFHQRFRNGQVVMIHGQAESFQQTVQVKILGAETLDQSGVDAARYLPSSPHDPEQMYDELLKLVRGLENRHLRGLILDLLKEPGLALDLKRAPAAKKFHHAYVGGLLEHTLSVTKGARKLAGVYSELNRDLLLAGAVLHDIGKVREFDLGLTGDYTTAGRLLGHIVLGLEILDRRLVARPGFPADLALCLKHLLVSHHGEEVNGSPRKPVTLEALALHYLDDLDAKMNAARNFIAERADKETGWTDFHQLLGRYLYRPGPVDSAPTDDREPNSPRGSRREATGTESGPPSQEAGLLGLFGD